MPFDSPKPVDAMSDDELVDTLRELNGTPESVLRDPELMDLVFPVIKADFAAVDRWRCRPERPLSVPITAIAGQADRQVIPELVRAWQLHTREDLQFRTFSGDHFFLQSHERELLDLIVRTLDGEW